MGQLHRKLAIAALAMVPCIAPVPAQDWPTRPLTLVVGFPAGGADDALARILALPLSEALGQQITIENIDGRGGMTGAARVAKAAPDGYEFMLGSSSIHAASQALYKSPPYNSESDFAPVALLVEQPFVLIARKSLSANTLQEFITYAKMNGLKVQYGSAGSGSATHLACERLNAATGISIKHVAYNGGAPALRDLIAEKIDYQCPVVTLPLARIRSGDVKAIAILSRQRSSTLPDVATAHEQGLADFEATTWFAFFLPRDTPLAIVQKLNAAVTATLEVPSVQTRLKEAGAEIVARERRSPDYLRAFLKSEIDKWAATVKAANIQLD